jgi:hypothetical protein
MVEWEAEAAAVFVEDVAAEIISSTQNKRNKLRSFSHQEYVYFL